MWRCCLSTRIVVEVITLVVLLSAFSISLGRAEQDAPSNIPPYDIYVMIGEIGIWMGDEIRYTVVEPTVVEARMMTPSGEIIVLLQQGQQAPGQYTLPWHGAAYGSPMAGLYFFELYFGDEYAARLQIIVAPIMATS